MYTDYSSISTNVLGSFTYPISVTFVRCGGYPLYYSTTVGVYIDYNQNGVFDLPQELVFSSGPYYNSSIYSYTFTGNITIPVTAAAGQTKMRVVVTEGSSTSPCGTYTWGETEDYTVNIIPFNKDLALLSWNTPQSGCNLTGTEPVSVTYKNNALQAQNDYYLSFYNGTSWTSEHVTTPINPGQTLSYTFTGLGNFSVLGEHVCKAAVSLAGDVVTTNDTLKNIKIRNYPTIVVTDPYVTPVPGSYIQNFDGAPAYWFPNGVNSEWALGTPAKTFLNGAASAPNAWVTKLTGNYSNNVFAWMESPCFDLSQTVNPLFFMDIKYQTESNWDGALLMYTTDDMNWYLMGALYDPTNWYNDTAANGLPVWGGQSSGNDYETVIHQLVGLGGAPHVKLGVLWMSDEYVNYEGFAFDNVKIEESAELFATCPDINIEGAVGDTLNLFIKGGQPPYHVVWSPAIGLSCNDLLCGPNCVPINCLRPIAAPPVTTTYTATVTDSKPNKADVTTATVTVHVYPDLELDARWDATVCDTARTQLLAYVVGGVPPYDFVWSPAAGLSNPFIANPIDTSHVTTTYTVTVTDALGFFKTDAITITKVSGWAQVDIHPDGGSVCTGDGLLLTATGGMTYVWSVYPVYSDPTIDGATSYSVLVHPTVSGTKYTCVIHSPCGTSSDFAIVYVLPRPTPTLAAFNPAGYCFGHEPIVLTGGLPLGGTYSGVGVSKVGADYFFDPSVGAGTYTITYAYINPLINNCPGYATRPMIVYPTPSMVFNLPVDAVCVDLAPFQLSGGQPFNGVYSWTDAAGNVITNGWFDPAAAGVGDHEITYTYTSPQGCTNFKTDMITVNPLPEVTVGPFNDVCINGGTVDLSDPLNGTPGAPAGGIYSGYGVTTSPVFDPLVAGAGTHTIIYSYTDVNGCTNFAQTSIVVKPLPELTAHVTNTDICIGSTATYTLDLVGTGPWTIEWMNCDGALPDMIATASPFTFDITPSVVGTCEYTITSITDDGNGCTNDIDDISWTITVNAYPLDYYVIMNDPNGHYCYGTNGISVGLSGSEIGVTYKLYKDGVYVPGSDFPGPGTSFFFYPNVFEDGVYTVEAVSDVAPTSCSKMMASPNGTLYFVHIYTDYLDVNIDTEFSAICLGGTSLLEAYIVNPNISTGPYNFDWSPDYHISPNGYTTVLVDPLVTTTYTVLVSDPDGCWGTESTTITVNLPPSVTINGGVSDLICDGQGVILQTNVVQGSGTTTTGFLWSPTETLDQTNPAAPVASPHANTTYTVVVTDDNGCVAEASHNVLVTPSPNVVFGGPTTHHICIGGNVTIPLLVPTVGSGNYSYSWSPATGLSATNVRTPIATPAATTTYTVVITDNYSGCTTSGTYEVFVNAPIVVDLGPNFNVCNGTAANLFANVISGGYAPLNFVWSSNPPLTIAPTQNPSVVPAQNFPLAVTTVFTVTVTDYYGCTGTDNLAITSDQYPVAHAGLNDTICEDECVTLIGQGGTAYQWFIGLTPISGVLINSAITVCPAVTTTYTLRVTSPCGAAFTYVTVVVNPKTPLNIFIPKNSFCLNENPVTLIGTPTDANGTFSGNGITDNGDGTALFTPNVVGTYDLTYTYKNEFGCEYSITTSVTVLPLPVVTFPDIADVCLNTPAFTLDGGLPLGGVYGGPGVIGSVFTPSQAGLGLQTLTYTFSDGNSCINTASIEVMVNVVPDIFTVTVNNNGVVCDYPNQIGVEITLSGSQPFEDHIDYHLILDGNVTVSTMHSTGAPIVFPPQTANGVYTVIAENHITGCSQLMDGNALISVKPLPIVYNMTGGGSYCQNGGGIVVGLDNSNYGITYKLMRATTLTGSPSFTGETHVGVNGPFSFNAQTAAGWYSVVAESEFGCEQNMAGSVEVIVLPLPIKKPVIINGSTVSASVCQGSTVTIRLNGPECGVTYELYFNDQPTGITRTCANGATITWISTTYSAGVFKIHGHRFNPNTGCENWMLNSVTLNYYQGISVTNPESQTIDEGGNAVFTVTAFGTNPGYQWQYSIDGINYQNVTDQPGRYAGATSATLNVYNATYDMTRYLYRVRVVGTCTGNNPVYSGAATLYIYPIVGVYLENVTACANKTAQESIDVPIVFTHADSISAISMSIYFDNTNFSYAGFTDLGPGLQINQLSVFAGPNWVKISYFDVATAINSYATPFTFLKLKFNGMNAGGTTHHLWFDMVTQGGNELSALSTRILTTEYHDGDVHVIANPVILTAWAEAYEVNVGDPIVLHATATHPEGVTYTWIRPNGQGTTTSTNGDLYIGSAVMADGGEYILIVTSNENGCTTSNIEKAAIYIIVHPLPTPENVYLPGFPNGIGHACAGSGVEISMDYTEVGVTYDLYLLPNWGTPVATIQGVNGPATFGPVGQSGTYSVIGTSLWNGHTQMLGSVTVQISPIPLWFYVTGGGHYCIGGPGREIKLSGSQPGVQYTLLLNACCCQADSIIGTVIGTGSPISFGFHTTPGYYSVVAYNPNTTCSNNMIGCQPIIIDPLPTAHLAGLASVCYGQCGTLTLTMTGRAPWSVVLSNGQTVVANTASFSFQECPLVSTIYSIVSVTDANGCVNTGTGSGTVNIYPLPIAAAINNGGTNGVCVGGSIQLTATVTEGTGPYTFIWTSNPPGFNSTDQNPLVTSSATLADAKTYCVVVTDAHNCVSAEQACTQVIVNPLPTVIVEANTPCLGYGLTITAIPSGNGPFTFAWTGPNGELYTGATISIAHAALINAGVYHVTVTDSKGCVGTGQGTVSIHTPPVVQCGQAVTVCVNQPINLSVTATGNGAFSYLWTGPNGYVNTNQSPTISSATLLNAGSYKVQVTDAFGCIDSCRMTVVVNPLPCRMTIHVSDPNVFCYGCIPPEIWIGTPGCNSEIGVNYELYRGGVATGIIKAGDGSNHISFGLIQTPGWYTVRAINVATGCIEWMYGEVEVIEQNPPTATITGDVICAGEIPEMTIVLTGDTYWDVIISDGLHKDTIHVTSSPYIYIPGTGPHILAPTVTTTYTIINVKDRVCYNIGNSAQVIVNPLPAKFGMTGSGYYCNGIGVPVGLTGSELGVNYTLYRNGSLVITLPGTGAPLTFGPQPAGNYTAVGVNAITGCTSYMNGITIINSDPGLTGYEVSGGGPYCTGSGGVTIYMGPSSQTGKEYKLLLDGIFTGISKIGNGSPLQFLGVLTPGTYTVLAYDPITTCTKTMNGFAVVSVRPLPTACISANVTICYGDVATLHVDLTGTAPWQVVISDNSNTKVHHILTNHWDTIVNPSSTKVYSITSVVDAYCSNTSTCTATVTVNSPTPYVLTGGGSYCAGESGVIVGLGGSQLGVTYTLLVNGNVVGTYPGTGNPLSFGLQTIGGTYTVVATTLADGCSRTMSGTVTITVNPLPIPYDVSGGGACCVGCTHVFVCLDNSQVGIRYELFINGVATGIYRTGTGAKICYDYATIEGDYTIKGVNLVTGCWAMMNGFVHVTLWPTAQAGISGNSSICAGETANLIVTFTVGTPPFSFYLSDGSTLTLYENITVNPYTVVVHPLSSKTYTLASVSDAHGCTNTNTTGYATVTVTPLPGVTLQDFSPVCINVAPFALTGGSPAGGVYSWMDSYGNLITTGIFDPAAAGAGSHVINYTYTNTNGCQGFAVPKTLVVNPLPQPYFTPMSAGYCVDAPAVYLEGNYMPGGTFSGPGVTDNGNGTGWFSPMLAGVGGPYTVTYAYTNANGCSASTSQVVSVGALPIISVTGITNMGHYCLNNPDIEMFGTPGGGVFSGVGVVNGHFFSPAVAGVGEHFITYSYTNGNLCTNSMTIVVYVDPLPSGCTFTGGGTCCIGCSVYGYLNCYTETNVSYQLVNSLGDVGQAKMGTGSGLSWEIFLGGNYHIVATNVITGCSVVLPGVITVTITPQPTATISGNVALCQGQCTIIHVDLTGTPPIELWFSDGVDTTVIHNVMTNFWETTVCPLTTTTYRIVSMFDAYCGSFGSGPVTVTVNPTPVVFDVTGGGTVCENASGVTVGLSSSEIGVYYELFRNGVTTGDVHVGNGFAFDFGYYNVAGNYTVHSMSLLTCDYVMNGSVDIIVSTLPTVTLYPFNNVCEGTPAFALSGGYPDGGTYAVDGIQVSYFDPAIVGDGNHIISYTYGDVNSGCSNTADASITVYDLPYVTLDDFYPVCFDAAEFDLTGGNPVGGFYYVNGVLATSFNPSAYGAGTYQVTYEYYDGNGCSATANKNLVVNAMPNVTIPQYGNLCLNGDPLVLTGGFPGGGEYSGDGVVNGVFTPSAVGTFAITYTYVDGNGCIGSATSEISVAGCYVYGLSGNVTYGNTANTPMHAITVILKQGTTTLATTPTDQDGFYSFTNLAPGAYTVSASSTKAWGGVNSNDALLIMKHFAGITPLHGIYLKAANVNGDGVVNSIDALMVAKRFVNQINSFPVGDWAFEVNTVTIINTDVINNFKAECYGDVNATYTPPFAKITPSINLNTAGVKEIKSYESFELPINVKGTLKVGAISMVIYYPENLINVEGVAVCNNITNDVLFTAIDGELRISWYNMKEINLSDMDALLTLQLRTKNINGVANGELALTLDAISELGDRYATVIQNVNLTYPKLAVAVEEYSISNYPNPFKDVTEIVYNLPENGKVTLKVYNLLGEVVSTLVDNVEQAANTYKVNFDGNSLVPGIYTYKIEVKGQSKDYLKSGMMVLSK
ncbi:MAG: GEVED domain-containing protein [Bacteroidetes bacterium]|nr:GEVED domain-containing protein [Bacteroidota bacterium]